MLFGFGLGELLFLVIALGVLSALVLLAAWGILKISGRSRSARDTESRRLAAELQEAHHRIGQLEAKLTRAGESSSSTQELLHRARDGR